MKKRFADEQIIAMLKSKKLARRRQTCAGVTASLRVHFANTNRSMAAWSCQTQRGCER